MLTSPLLAVALALAAPPPSPAPATPPAPPTPPTPPAAAAPAEKTEHIEAIKRYLAAKYDDAVVQPNGGARMYGLAYLPWSKPPAPLAAEGLRRWLPETRFYSAILSTGHFEYPDVPVLVSVAPAPGGGLDVRSMVAPNYLDSSAKFLAHFAAPSVPEGERVAYARAIAALITSVFTEMKPGEPSGPSPWITVPLLEPDYGNRVYRQLKLLFSDAFPGNEVFLAKPDPEGRPAGQ